ncbi:DUF6455 family protein [Jannaschia sp. M317]|uniref:DUF6455 family protein n=1 Tax=Jannaschia sp. M317 TaxID=2867011 RepID=UPI0021A86504|nr:DUF6455 family protein [Jannaschia sp. M317]UWQ18902.1 hypothetical protein K3551_06365 [Jannaschia sp. M317]
MTRPHPMGDARKHLMLLRTMAAQTGADTVLAFDEGTLDADGWNSAITRCRNCDWAQGCRDWLADASAEYPREVPKACANSDMLRGLRLPG